MIELGGGSLKKNHVTSPKVLEEEFEPISEHLELYPEITQA